MWFPIVQRELRVASRRSATFWFRLISPICALLFIFSSLISKADSNPSSRGRSIFEILGGVLFVLSLLAGLQYTADSIQEERREGTLDLLKLTGLRGIDVIAGKLTANSLGAFFSLVAAFPILALPLLLGGVSGGQLFKTVLLLAATLLLSLAIGIFASAQAVTRQAALRQAATITAIISMVGIIGLFYLRARKDFERRANSYPAIEQSADFVVLFLVFVMMVAFGLPLGAPAVILLQTLAGPASILGNVAFVVSLAILLGLIIYFLKKADPFNAPVDQEERFRSLALWQARLSRSRLYKHMDPILWLISRNRPNTFVITWLAIFVAVFQYAALTSMDSLGKLGEASWIAFILFAGLVFVLARQASSFFSEAQESGMFEVLLTTPLSWRHLFRTQKSAFTNFATWPLGIVAVSEVAAELSLLGSDPNRSVRIIALLLPALTIASYFLCREAIFWGSLFFALRSRNAFHSAGKVCLLLAIIPGLATYVLPLDKVYELFPYAELFLVVLFYMAIFEAFIIYVRGLLHRQFEATSENLALRDKLLRLISASKR